jgi:phage baseplate assembly protein W
MIRPFRRTEHQDYATDSGTPLVISCVEQVLGTPLGTLPWEPGFGSELFRLRHKSQDPTFLDLCRIYSAEAIARWEPRATVISCERELNSLPLGRSSYVGLIIKVRIGGRVFSARARV